MVEIMSKKEYTPIEVLNELRKSLHKMLCKTISSIKKKDYAKKITQEIVEDILDPNDIAEVDGDKIPPRNKSVLHKGRKKGIDKIKDLKKNKKTVCK